MPATRGSPEWTSRRSRCGPSAPARPRTAGSSRHWPPCLYLPTPAGRGWALSEECSACIVLSAGLSSRCRPRCRGSANLSQCTVAVRNRAGAPASGDPPRPRRFGTDPVRDDRDRAQLSRPPRRLALSPSQSGADPTPRGPSRPTVRAWTTTPARSIPASTCPGSRDGRSRSSVVSGCCTAISRTGSACRSCTRAGPARRWKTSRSSSGWARARCTRSARSGRSTSRTATSRRS